VASTDLEEVEHQDDCLDTWSSAADGDWVEAKGGVGAGTGDKEPSFDFQSFTESTFSSRWVWRG
jgi:hypothetical protein